MAKLECKTIKETNEIVLRTKDGNRTIYMRVSKKEEANFSPPELLNIMVVVNAETKKLSNTEASSFIVEFNEKIVCLNFLIIDYNLIIDKVHLITKDFFEKIKNENTIIHQSQINTTINNINVNHENSN